MLEELIKIQIRIAWEGFKLNSLVAEAKKIQAERAKEVK